MGGDDSKENLEIIHILTHEAIHTTVIHKNLISILWIVLLHGGHKMRNYYKQIISSFALSYIIILLFNSCLGLQIHPISNKPTYGFTMKEEDHEKYEIIGFVEIEFEVLASNDENTIRRKVYDGLLTEAKLKFNEDVLIRNIKYTKHNSKKNMWFLLGASYRMEYLIIRSTGAVVKEKVNNNSENTNAHATVSAIGHAT
jgi:hypothetical protein